MMSRANLLLALAILLSVFGIVQGYLGFEPFTRGYISGFRYLSMAVAPILVGIALYFGARGIKSGQEAPDA
jgi:hypothetical protein